MLQEFIVANRREIIDRVRRRTMLHSTHGRSAETEPEHGVPTLLSQIVAALAEARILPVLPTQSTTTEIMDQAALHGHQLLRSGTTVTQVVNG